MDVDVEIISEDGDCSNPLFDSIMVAMNSMKEATADKIYQKIQRKGENSYSKPQVDRALANALRYGIFEKRNNRYRVRDDIIDEENSMYWKLDKSRGQTPFRLQEDYSDTQRGPNLDPETDNKRFMNLKKTNKCFKCGRIKRPEKRENKVRQRKEKRKMASTKRAQSRQNKAKIMLKKKSKKYPKLKYEMKRRDALRKKTLAGPPKFKKNPRKGKIMGNVAAMWALNCTNLRSSSFDRSLNNLEPGKNILLGKSTYDSSDSEMDTLSSPTDEQSFKSYPNDNHQKFQDPYKDPRSPLSSEYDQVDDYNYDLQKKAKSKDSLKSDSGSEKSDLSSMTNPTTTPSLSCLNKPSLSKTLNEKEFNEFLATGELYNNQFEENQDNKCNEKTDWIGCPDEPQTAIIQTKNVLTIEPIDSLTLKSPDHTTYVS